MANESNLTTNATSQVIERVGDTTSVLKDYVPLVLVRMWELVAAPFKHQEMLWIIFPLVLTLIVLEFYFDRHGDEELGWAAAVANSLILFIVAIDLIKHSFHNATPWEVLSEVTSAIFTDATLGLPPQVLLLIIFVGSLGIAVTIINYFHLLPRKLAFEVSGHPPINFIAYMAIVIVYTADKPDAIPLDLATLIAGVLLYVLLLLLVFMIRKSVQRVIQGSGGRSGTRIWR